MNVSSLALKFLNPHFKHSRDCNSRVLSVTQAQMEATMMPVQDGVLLLSTSSQELVWGKTLLRSPAAVKPLTVEMGRKLCPSKAPGGMGLVSQLYRFSKGWDPEVILGQCCPLTLTFR